LDEQASKHKAAIVLKNSDAMEALSAGPCTADMQIASAGPLLMQKKHTGAAAEASSRICSRVLQSAS